MSQLNPNHAQDAQDRYFMMLAIEQAKQGLYTTRPNPAVGCVIVQGETVVGQGFHPKAGQPHAEVFALKEAGNNATGATAYVTLEPCSHTGRTPPCAQALVDAGVKRVVIAALDPNPQVAGRGIRLLEQAGIEVTVGVLTSQAESLNRGFLKAMLTQMPYVRLKIATSLDGRTAMASGESKWITSSASREDVQRLRAQSGAIITGSNTIIADDPQLNVRSTKLGVSFEEVPKPLIVVLDRRQRLGHSPKSNYQLCRRTDTLYWREDSLVALLKALVSDHQCYDVLVEAGASVAGSFLSQHLVDELIVYQAPCLLGAQARPMVDFNPLALAQQRRLRIGSHEQTGSDLKLILFPV
ncbi:bifunctional diaminohydroxyphosphoribosylaminopyrimidine deaminase/5-amino-6-(5-phosphoribosylamino)uracil reductase RibD [Psychrobacter sp.]|uniref:bifunctional diaminohydroxyphosphoribosylaminopyrimidine deaminase/5-amino-6-(5-phosphoribosylamino)uracil reductase RibD n=1 Tax=Psychrobacter sp. TaxID=56811 RepID=UPI002647E8FA|nr:bifunctional diaminohydroxyphosphoribosylaminopyrimidine deaminase/5-amino-6-(5-phosphoribosylamino)uracil reductase RibD [Psychrobacter sp.]MDN6276073.1 bifunctional diaminohydroxyphosphoribosylaminopyrimidine deaminase/5-amino-6-(5-phosphoribosylamino)uracil reductase RibD [Psychrobacter sp.]MDN6308480.1 bifunctional diaminohydroxyphosphoribosylaminopyrimidine deaminase/5-amino-6-(5-phosphoribosylamino)uracil reductase RibD [Psychrobacter sp.]